MKLREELSVLVTALNEKEVPYALCGGLAMAVYGWPRATMDIDLLIQESDLASTIELAHTLGFTHQSGEVEFAAGDVRLCRLVKMMGGDFLPLDLLIVTPELQLVWDSRQIIETDSGPLSIVSSDGLIRMKSMRGSGVDKDDIDKLRGDDAS